MSQITEQVSSHGVNKQSWGKRSDDWWSLTSQYLKVRRVRILTLREDSSLFTVHGAEMYPSFHFPEGVSQSALQSQGEDATKLELCGQNGNKKPDLLLLSLFENHAYSEG